MMKQSLPMIAVLLKLYLFDFLQANCVGQNLTESVGL